MPQSRPFTRPCVPRRLTDQHVRPALLVLHARVVLDPSRDAAVPEMRPGVLGPEADGDDGSRAGGWRAPLAVRVVTAVGARYPERRAVAVDGSGLPIVPRQDHRAGNGA